MAVRADANYGFAGSITTVQWARVARLLGFRYCVEEPTSLVPAVVSGTRALDISAGAAWGSGVLSLFNSTTRLTFATPSAGQWFAVVIRRVWGAKTAELIVLDGPTTSTTQPTEPPSALPTTAVTNPGVQDDALLFWAWASNATSTVVLFDMRLVPGISDLVAVTGSGRFGVVAPRYGDEIAALDTGRRYRWNGTRWGAPVGLTPLTPTSISGINATLNPDGVVILNSSGGVQFRGIFTEEFDLYHIHARLRSNAENRAILLRLASGTQDDTAAAYFYSGAHTTRAASSVVQWNGNGRSEFDIGRVGSGGDGVMDTEVYYPTLSTVRTRAQWKSTGSNDATDVYIDAGGNLAASTVHDGFTIFPAAGIITGRVSVFGYNRG